MLLMLLRGRQLISLFSSSSPCQFNVIQMLFYESLSLQVMAYKGYLRLNSGGGKVAQPKSIRKARLGHLMPGGTLGEAVHFPK